MAVSSTVTIDYEDRKPNKAAAVIYGRVKARIGSATLRAKDFNLSTIRSVQLTLQSADAKLYGTPVIGSLLSAGSLGNYFKLKGATAGTLARNIHYVVVGE